MVEPFRDRRAAGRELSRHLAAYANRDDVLVLGLPRGGVPVAYEVARALKAPLDILVVRKLGVPGFEELAMGAIASGGVRTLNREVIDDLHIPRSSIEEVTAREAEELRRRERLYRGDNPSPVIEGKTVILVDDGLATGSTMHAAVTAVRAQHPQRVIVAVPVGASSTCQAFNEVADEAICAVIPPRFEAVGRWYADFSPTSDQEVHDLLQDAREGFTRTPSPGDRDRVEYL